MRSGIAPGATFPDYQLPDHTKVPRQLSEVSAPGPREAWDRDDRSPFHGFD
jgi:hypothetical protein